MKTKSSGRAGAACLIFGLLLQPLAGASQAAKPSAKDKCPVCGMFVAEYGDFLAEVVFQDGFRAYFDGPKDMFRYIFQPDKYHPGRKQADIASIWVTDYYSLEWIDGKRALYVIGSDVRGPMGNELIPVGLEPEAKAFLNDHKGKSIFRFEDITLEIVNSLD